MTVQQIRTIVLKIIFRLLCLVSLLFSYACQQQEDEKLGLKITPPENKKQALIFLVHPYDTPSQLISRFQPLCDYLQEQIGQPIKLQLASSYVDQIKRISNGQADLAYMGPTPFLRAQDNYLAGQQQQSLTTIAAEATNEQNGYHSVIVVKSQSHIKDISQLKGKSFAFGAPHSFSSHYAPRTMLSAAKLSLRNLKDYAYLGSHERVALAVLHGDFDAGGLRLAVANKYTQRSPGIKIIAHSPALPPHLIVARHGLDNKMIKKISLALLNTPNTNFKKASSALGNGTYFIKPDLSLFDNTRQVIEAIETHTKVPEQW